MIKKIPTLFMWHYLVAEAHCQATRPSDEDIGDEDVPSVWDEIGVVDSVHLDAKIT